MTAFILGLLITVGQPGGLLGRWLTALKDGIAQRVIDIGLAVPHRSSMAFPRPFPLSDFEASQRSKTVNSSQKKRGSFLGIQALHGSQKPESRATLKSIFGWNFGIYEKWMLCLVAVVIILIGVVLARSSATLIGWWGFCLDCFAWPVDAISMMPWSW